MLVGKFKTLEDHHAIIVQRDSQPSAS